MALHDDIAPEATQRVRIAFPNPHDRNTADIKENPGCEFGASKEN